MPQYEFFCNACEQPFSKTLTADEFEERSTVCPVCDSEDVEQRLAAFYLINWKLCYRHLGSNQQGSFSEIREALCGD